MPDQPEATNQKKLVGKEGVPSNSNQIDIFNTKIKVLETLLYRSKWKAFVPLYTSMPFLACSENDLAVHNEGRRGC